ncbi:MAG TPA: MltA domain-containing protein [Candidatus Tectomicrobia bacterium]|jgi:membrane-bound lytic murein transglycosylase A
MLALLVLLGCSSMTLDAANIRSPWLRRAERPTLSDDLDRQSLLQALQHSLDYVQRLSPERSLPFGDRRISAATLQQTLATFQQIVEQARTPQALQAAIVEHFDLVQAAGRDGSGEVLFTGYFETVLPGSLTPTSEFTYPVYIAPPDLLDIDLGAFGSRYAGERLMARYEQGKVVPYFTRREIDTDGRLQGRNLEFVWLRDAIDGFFLHVQGSGKIHLPDGQTLRVQYAASNGHPYRSIGRLLLDEGRLTPEAMSLQSIRYYLRTHPEERTRVLNANPRYVFFHRVEEGPRGNLNVVLVPGRSIATDQQLFPPAGVAFIQTQKPVLNAQGEITGWQPLARFVFNHDAGSAITGPGRVDLFWGSDARAETAAGHMQHSGKLFFLLKRRALAEPPGTRPR